MNRDFEKDKKEYDDMSKKEYSEKQLFDALNNYINDSLGETDIDFSDGFCGTYWNVSATIGVPFFEDGTKCVDLSWGCCDSEKSIKINLEQAKELKRMLDRAIEELEK